MKNNQDITQYIKKILFTLKKNIKKILKKKKNLYLKYYRMFKDINSIRLLKNPKIQKVITGFKL